MSSQDLPPPTTGVEMYLAAILEELRALRETLARPQPPADQVELREPAPREPVRHPAPDQRRRR